MTKLKINEQCSIRTEGVLYCLSDLYHYMDMRNVRSAPQHWATDRAGITLTKKGFLRKTYWGRRDILLNYAESLTPGIYREVRKALGLPDPKGVESACPAARSAVDTRDTDYEAMIQRADRRAPARRMQPAPTRGMSHGSRGSSSRRSQEDDMLSQLVAMSAVSSSHRSVDVDTCSSRHSSYSHSSHDYGSYDSGSSDGGGGGGCD